MIIKINSNMLVINYLLWASVLVFAIDLTIITAERPSYEIAYACDGKMLKIECKEGDVINLIRANYGRFSIVVCNDNNSTEWSVNCMSPKSFGILHTLCSRKRSCSIQANTSLFEDPCPGTVKYLDAHYRCVSATPSSSTHRPAPPWLISSQASVQSTVKSLTVDLDIVPPVTPSAVSTEKSHSSTKDDESCKPITFRNISWNLTYGGDIAVQPCPNGAHGIARWRCQVTANNTAIRFPDTPDLSDCKSVWLTSLVNRMTEGDAVLKVANDLVQVSESNILYGGDIIIVCKMIRDMVEKMAKDLPGFPDTRQREAVTFDLLRSVVLIGNNLIDSNSLSSWLDLAYKEQMLVASFLLVGLEENSFLFATTFSKERTVTHCQKNIILQVRVLESRNVGDVIFPTSLGNECHVKTGNYVKLHRTSLIENSELGIVRVLYMAFDNLENILKTQSVGKNEKRINSKILSASLGRGRHIQLNHLVTLCFEHLQTEYVGNPSCVFWDCTQNMWSEKGCILETTNKTHSICYCNHLANFAILVDVKSTSVAEDIVE